MALIKRREQLLAAIESGDERAAERVMQAHMENASTRLEAALRLHEHVGDKRIGKRAN